MLSLKPCPWGPLQLLPTSCFTAWMNLYTFTNFMCFFLCTFVFSTFPIGPPWLKQQFKPPWYSRHCGQLTAPASCFWFGLQGMRIRTTTSVARLETPLKFQHWDEPKIRCHFFKPERYPPRKKTTCLIGDTSWNGWFFHCHVSFPVGTFSKAHHSWYLC